MESTKTKAILKIKHARKPELTIKATFQDAADSARILEVGAMDVDEDVAVGAMPIRETGTTVSNRECKDKDSTIKVRQCINPPSPLTPIR